jgi:hypothetical protein
VAGLMSAGAGGGVCAMAWIGGIARMKKSAMSVGLRVMGVRPPTQS